MVSDKRVALRRFDGYRFPFLIVLLCCLIVGGAIMSIGLGASDVQWSLIMQSVFYPSLEPAIAMVIWDMRAPRVILALLIGMHFAVSGLILQRVLHNPLAEPSVLGISSGATLAVMIWLFASVFAGVSDTSRLITVSSSFIPIMAQLGGVLGIAIVYGLAMQGGVEPTRFVLMGAVVTAFLYAGAMVILVGWGSSRIEVVLTWLAGNLYGREWPHVQLILPWTLFMLLFLPVLLPSLQILALGSDDVARSLGLNVEVARFIAIAFAGCAAATAVGIAGPIAFIGLLAPHLARLLVGGSLKRCVPVSLLLGALITLLADLIGRIVVLPAEIPVGAVTPLLGAPFFLYLLAKR